MSRSATSQAASPSASPNRPSSTSARSRGLLEECVDERRHTGDLPYQQQNPQQKQYGDERQQPPEPLLPEELRQLRDRSGAGGHVFEHFHEGLLVMNTRSRTSESIPLRRNVLTASPAVLTIGSPRRLKEVLRSTGTPVARPKRSISA